MLLHEIIDLLVGIIFATWLLFTISNLAQHLIQAIQHIEDRIAVTPADHVDRTRRFQIFDWVLAVRLRLDLIQEEAVGSLREARTR
ncbi:hypothetical protein F5Y08DRAFT_93993 [Xylaria arbuscula]|nr:hypothetical protein F5Y08DRAFT_93993 [Xylaria arbuscula]